MKHLYSITVHGKHKTWNHLVWAKPEHAEEWRQDGIEVDEVLYIVPDLVQIMGLTRLWCWLQKIGLIPLG